MGIWRKEGGDLGGGGGGGGEFGGRRRRSRGTAGGSLGTKLRCQLNLMKSGSLVRGGGGGGGEGSSGCKIRSIQTSLRQHRSPALQDSLPG